MKKILAILLIIALGVALGVGIAVLKIKSAPWNPVIDEGRPPAGTSTTKAGELRTRPERHSERSEESRRHSGNPPIAAEILHCVQNDRMG